DPQVWQDRVYPSGAQVGSGTHLWRNWYGSYRGIRSAGLTASVPGARRRAETTRAACLRNLVRWLDPGQGPGQEGVPPVWLTRLKLVQGIREVPCRSAGLPNH